jgi:uncharacterized protein YbjT (DUF2867 family)
MILVTGGTGNIGQVLVKALLQAGESVRVLARTPEKAKKLLPDSVEVAIGQFEDTHSLERALAGVDRAFLISGGPHEAHQELNFVHTAARMRLPFLVKNSAQAVGFDPPAEHAKVEQAIMASGMGYTILRPTTFMQNMLWRIAPMVRTTGTFAVLRRNALSGMIDVRDIAESAAAVLYKPDAHFNAVYILTGGETFTYDDIAATLTRILLRSVEAVQVSPAALRQQLIAGGMPPHLADVLIGIEQNIITGASAVITDHTAQVMGKSPRTLTQFLCDYQDSFSTSEKEE